MATVAETSPYLYVATAFFVLSACSSDLLFLRFSLTGGFLFLVLSALSGFSSNGSFDNMPITEGIINIPMLVNMILCLLNFYIFVRLIRDERPCRGAKYLNNDKERALFRFFQSRCGLTILQFQDILRNGKFVQLPANTIVPDTQCTLYLICQGKVKGEAKFRPRQQVGQSFLVRSGQFFDIKLFNLFSLPIGFDNIEFQAMTLTRTQLFGWNVQGLIAMRDSSSPELKAFWEFLVLRSLAGIAVRRHLEVHDTLYDSLLIPEQANWLEGAPSRDFCKTEKPVGNLDHFQRQWRIIRASFWHIVPPHGVRHRPGIVEPNPKQAHIEMVCKAAALDRQSDDAAFTFLDNSSKNGNTTNNKNVNYELDKAADRDSGNYDDEQDDFSFL